MRVSIAALSRASDWNLKVKEKVRVESGALWTISCPEQWESLSSLVCDTDVTASKRPAISPNQNMSLQFQASSENFFCTTWSALDLYRMHSLWSRLLHNPGIHVHISPWVQALNSWHQIGSFKNIQCRCFSCPLQCGHADHSDFDFSITMVVHTALSNSIVNIL